MKLILEEETGTGENRIISKVKEVTSKQQAINDKRPGRKSFIHYCYHDKEIARNQYKPCKREEL